jgi:hypothetical protein
MQHGRASRRLAELAGQLGATQRPFYVRRPIPPGLRRNFPAEGWYWVPKGHNVAVYLGASELDAHYELTQQILDQEQIDAAS